MKFSKTSKWGILGVFLLILFLSISMTNAHQPRSVADTNSIQNSILVSNPEISQAFYGDLNGTPDYYQVKSDKEFRMYVNILIPDNPGPKQFISVEITDASGKVIAVLDGQNFTWESFYEEFGGDYYLKGPEFNQTMPAGTYYIKLYNQNNTGLYSLAVGDIETFPAGEALNALILLPALKSEIFKVPVATLFIQFMGIILAMGVFAVLYTLLIRSRKSEAILEITKTIYPTLNPIMWLGIAITTIMWFLTYFMKTSNIMAGIETLLLIIILLIHWNVNSKLKKLSIDKIPSKVSTILLIFWILFVFIRITLIQL
jgi:hypothetical protein